MKRIGLFAALFLLCFLTSCEEISAQTKEQNSGVITVSGTSFDMQNSIGAVSHTFEEIITGTPSTVSIVVQGCMRGGTCETIDTYTTVANAIRKPGSTSPYDYHHVTASWTGGTNPTVKVAKLGTLARSGGSSGGGATSLTGDVTGTTDSNTVSTVGASSAANIHSAELAANAAVSIDTFGTIIKRDGSGNFIANIITAALTGNASTSTALAANGTNCAAGSVPLGVDASGNAEGCTLPGVAIDAQVSTTPSILSTDRVELVTNNNASAIAETVPQAGSTNFANNFAFVQCNITGAGTVTDTPTTSTVNGNATFKLLPQTSGSNPECAFWWSDNSNYVAAEILPTDVNGRLAAVGMPAFTGDATNTAGALGMTVGKVNGAVIPTSATVTATNGSNQIIAASVQGNGTKVQLSTGSVTTQVVPKFDANGNTINSSITDNGTTVSTTEPITTTATGAGAFQCTGSTAQGHATASTITIECPASPTAYEIKLPSASASGVVHAADASAVNTWSFSSVVAADTDTSIAHTGIDVNTSYQVTATHLASALPVTQGGTQLGTLTSHAVYVGAGTSAPTALSVGATNTLLHGITGADPAFSAVVAADTDSSIAHTGVDINTSHQVTATHLASALPVAQGGTQLGTLTAHALYVGNGTSAPNAVGLGTNVTVLHGAAAGDPTYAVVTPSDAAGNTSGSGNFCLVTSCLMTTPNVNIIKDANAAPFIQSSATASAVDGITVTTAATANPATVTIAPSGSDSNINLGLNAKGSGIIQPATFMNATSHTAALTADWTCGTAGTVSACTSATIIGSGGGVPLTFTLPLQLLSWTLECDLVVGQATAATANSWNFLTATTGATNVTASYQMNTAATAMTGGATTDTAATTTTVVIGPTWTLGGTATKMPVRVWAKIEGAAAAGTVLSLQLVAPTAADVVTIYRGSSCRLR